MDESLGEAVMELLTRVEGQQVAILGALAALSDKISETAEIASVFNKFGAMMETSQEAGVHLLQKG